MQGQLITDEMKQQIHKRREQLSMQEEFYEKNGRDCTELEYEQIILAIAEVIDAPERSTPLPDIPKSETTAQRIALVSGLKKSMESLWQNHDMEGLFRCMDGLSLVVYMDGSDFYVEAVSADPEYKIPDFNHVFTDRTEDKDEALRRIPVLYEKVLGKLQEELTALWSEDFSQAFSANGWLFGWEAELQDYLQVAGYTGTQDKEENQ